MAGRIRTIKPDFFVDDEVARLGPLCRLLFVGMWTQADREGRLENRPLRLKAQLLPYDDQVDVATLLAELAAPPGRFLLLYEAEGKPLIQIRTFAEHQRPNTREAASILPPPPPGTEGDSGRDESHNLSRAGFRGREGKGREGKGREGGGGEAAPSGAPAERATPASAQDPGLLIFPTVRGARSGATDWRLTEAVATALREGFPDLDVLAEARRARLWILANTSRRKTADGMMDFLFRWLGRTQNRGGARPGTPAAQPREGARSGQPAAPGLCVFHVRAENANRAARRHDADCSECRHVAAANRRGNGAAPVPIGSIVGMPPPPEQPR